MTEEVTVVLSTVTGVAEPGSGRSATPPVGAGRGVARGYRAAQRKWRGGRKVQEEAARVGVGGGW